MNDLDYLKRATEIGNRKTPPYNFGAVVVKDGEVIGESESRVHETNDPSAHSEVLALKMAAEKIDNYSLDGATMYSSHEPCVMCFSCALWAGVGRIVYAVSAEEQSEFMYEFKGLRLEELTKYAARVHPKIEHVPIDY